MFNVSLFQGPADVDVNVDEVIADNQQRMRGGPRMLRVVPEALLRAALEERPELLDVLLRQVQAGMPGEEDNEEEEGARGGPEVACRTQ